MKEHNKESAAFPFHKHKKSHIKPKVEIILETSLNVSADPFKMTGEGLELEEEELVEFTDPVVVGVLAFAGGLAAVPGIKPVFANKPSSYNRERAIHLEISVTVYPDFNNKSKAPGTCAAVVLYKSCCKEIAPIWGCVSHLLNVDKTVEGFCQSFVSLFHITTVKPRALSIERTLSSISPSIFKF